MSTHVDVRVGLRVGSLSVRLISVFKRGWTSWDVVQRVYAFANVGPRFRTSNLLSCVHLRQRMRSNPREMTCINVCLTHNNVVPGSTNKTLDLGLRASFLLAAADVLH